MPSHPLKHSLALLAVGALALGACKRGKEETPDAGPQGPVAVQEQEPNDRPEQALALAQDSLLSGSLKADPTRVDEDWVKLVPGPQGARLADLQLSGMPGGDVVLEVYDQDRNRLAAVNSEGEGKGERLPNLLVEGERWVRVATARKGMGGAYTLTVLYRAAQEGEEREPNDRAVDAHPLVLGQAVTGFIGHAGDEDWYRVELAPEPPDAGSAPAAAPAAAEAPDAAVPAEPQQAEAPADAGEDAGTATAAAPPPEPPSTALRIELSALPGVRPELQVLSAAEAPLFSLRGKEGEALQLRNIGVRGTDRVVYVVVKSAWSGTGKDARRSYNAQQPYTLTVAVEEAGAQAELEPNDDLAHATPLAAGGWREGFLSPRTDVDYYVYRPEQPSLVRAELSGTERLDLVLSLVEAPAVEGGKETVVLRANDGAVKEPERLNSVRCEGACYFKVETAPRLVDGKWVRDMENAEQAYRLTLTATPDTGAEEREPNNTADRSTQIVLGQPIRGTVYPKKDSDWYRLDLGQQPVRTPVRATLTGILKVDVGLYLYRVGEDGKPVLVQTADRAKGDQPETIRYSAEPGEYLFEVRDSKNREANFQDAYQLTVEQGE